MWRILFAAFLFLLSLLVLFRAPTNFFWRVAVAVTEFPWIFIFTALLLFISCFWAERYKLISLAISGISMIIFSLPVIRAYQRAAYLPDELAKIFPLGKNVGGKKDPYSFFKMFSGIGIREVTPQKFVYKKIPGNDLVIDFYASSVSSKKTPCLIVIHGGSWSEGDEKQLPDLNSYLANRGINVAAISYRLAPQFKSPAQVEDTKDALRFLVENSGKLNIDTNNFILLGRSAGGQIALVSAYSFHDPKIKGVISFYAPADMVWGGRIKGNPWVLNTDKVFADYLGGSIDEVPQKYSESSSCEYVDANSPPTLLVHGEIDAMVSFRHSIRLQKKLDEFHVKNYLLDLPDATHGCDYNINGPSGQLSTYAVEEFIFSVTGGTNVQ
ncbi:MAG: alpha/beta hydrolase [Bacteroidetes bacterium]|nr:alpha/beta hydrolase [Bacteroidota bacterium]